MGGQFWAMGRFNLLGGQNNLLGGHVNLFSQANLKGAPPPPLIFGRNRAPDCSVWAPHAPLFFLKSVCTPVPYLKIPKSSSVIHLPAGTFFVLILLYPDVLFVCLFVFSCTKYAPCFAVHGSKESRTP